MKLQLTIVVWLLPHLIASAVVAQEPAPAGATNPIAGWGFTIELGTDLTMRASTARHGALPDPVGAVAQRSD